MWVSWSLQESFGVNRGRLELTAVFRGCLGVNWGLSVSTEGQQGLFGVSREQREKMGVNRGQCWSAGTDQGHLGSLRVNREHFQYFYLKYHVSLLSWFFESFQSYLSLKVSILWKLSPKLWAKFVFDGTNDMLLDFKVLFKFINWAKLCLGPAKSEYRKL